MLLKNAIVISLFLAIFFGGREKTIWKWYARTRIFWQRRKKSPFLKNIRICVEVALVISLQVPVFLGGENKTKERKTSWTCKYKY